MRSHNGIPDNPDTMPTPNQSSGNNIRPISNRSSGNVYINNSTIKTLIYIIIVLIIFASARAHSIKTDKLGVMEHLEYTVKEGDTLGKIASRYDVSLGKLYELNKTQVDDMDLIKMGQKIIIPAKEEICQ